MRRLIESNAQMSPAVYSSKSNVQICVSVPKCEEVSTWRRPSWQSIFGIVTFLCNSKGGDNSDLNCCVGNHQIAF